MIDTQQSTVQSASTVLIFNSKLLQLDNTKGSSAKKHFVIFFFFNTNFTQ